MKLPSSRFAELVYGVVREYASQFSEVMPAWDDASTDIHAAVVAGVEEYMVAGDTAKGFQAVTTSMAGHGWTFGRFDAAAKTCLFSSEEHAKTGHQAIWYAAFSVIPFFKDL